MAKLSVDFTNVAEGGGNFDIAPGRYIAKVVDVKLEGPGQSGFKYLKWELSIAEGVHKNARINHITTLKPEGLFSLRDTLTACGLNIPKGPVSFDPAKLTGKTLGIDVGIREYDGKEYPNVKGVYNPAEEDGDDDANDVVPF